MQRILIAAIWIFLATSAHAGKPEISVFSAASFKEATEDLARRFEKKCECTIRISFGATGTLARQISAGAPADIFISADSRWTQWLIENHSVADQNVKTIARNELVLLSRKTGRPEELLSKRFAMGEPLSVPAGRYAKQALAGLKLWENAKKQAIFTENVRVALSMVSRRSVTSAIVYGSDALLAPDLGVAFSFEGTLHDPILYQAALISDSSKAAKDFLDFLGSEEAQSVLQTYGFGPPNP